MSEIITLTGFFCNCCRTWNVRSAPKTGEVVWASPNHCGACGRSVYARPRRPAR